MTQESVPTPAQPAAPSFLGSLVQLGKRPRILLLLLAGWSLLAWLAQVFVNGGLFLDIHEEELDGAMGGFAFGFQSLPLALLYLYCWRDPAHYRSVFWLALAHQGALCAGVIYQLVIGTFSFESVVIPLVGSAALAVFSLLQIFEPQTAEEA